MSRKTRRALNKTKKLRTLSLESLEERALLYSVGVLPWPSTDLSYSIVPDGTSWNTYANTQSESVWHQTLNGLTDSETWQRDVATAFQSWANHSNLNFQRVSDDGAAYGHQLGQQGDIRIGSIDAGSADGWAFFPAGGQGGDITIKSDSAFLNLKYWSDTRLISLLTHEIGHSLGLLHSDVMGSVMGGNRSSFVGLEADDIDGIQSIYGAREHDSFDQASSNDHFSTASPLAMDDGAIDFRADLTSHDDVDHYRLTVPAGGQSFTVSADARQLSLLAPMVQVFDSSNRLVAQASGDYGTDATVRIDGLQGGESYTVVVDGATDDVFGMGAYQLVIDAVVNTAGEGVLVEPIEVPATTLDRTESEMTPAPAVEPENVATSPAPIIPDVIPPVLVESAPTEEILPPAEIILPTTTPETVETTAEHAAQPPLQIDLALEREPPTTVIDPSTNNEPDSASVVPPTVVTAPPTLELDPPSVVLGPSLPPHVRLIASTPRYERLQVLRRLRFARIQPISSVETTQDPAPIVVTAPPVTIASPATQPNETAVRLNSPPTKIRLGLRRFFLSSSFVAPPVSQLADAVFASTPAGELNRGDQILTDELLDVVASGIAGA